MKKLVVLLVLAGAGYLGYHGWRVRRAPLETFRQFADAVARGRLDLARQVAEVDIEAMKQGERYRIVGWVPVDYLHGTSYTIDSEARSADGSEVTLQVTQEVRFDPPGTTSALGGAMKATFRQMALLRHTAAGWRVISFTSEPLETAEAR